MKRRKSKLWLISKEELQNILDTCSTKVQVLELLGFDGYNGNHRTLSKRIKEDNLDETTLNKNREKWIIEHLENTKNKQELKEILIENSKFTRKNLKKTIN